MSVSTWILLKKFTTKNVLNPSVLHPDGCYGLSLLGKLNISLLIPYFLSYFVIFMLLITHEAHYFSIIFPLVFLTIVFLVASFVTIGPIIGLGKRINKETYNRLVSISKTYEKKEKHSDRHFIVERICYQFSSGAPYTKTASAVLNFMRVVTVIMTTSRFLF
jgi:hypothetical protein